MSASALPFALIVGLGNPGPTYERTRHNAGFWFVDELARRHGSAFRIEPKFFGETSRLSLNGREYWLLKPATFMNRSGQAVVSMAGFYKVPPESILVVHDEIDLPPGTVRLKRGGGHGGHNGLRDLIARLGGGFARLRIGVGHPGSSDQVVDYVLNRPSKQDEELILKAIDEAADAFPLIVEGGFEKAMHRLHSRK